MKNPSLLETMKLTLAEPAFARAAQQAQRIARQAGTPIAVWQDGAVRLIPPESVPPPGPIQVRSEELSL